MEALAGDAENDWAMGCIMDYGGRVMVLTLLQRFLERRRG